MDELEESKVMKIMQMGFPNLESVKEALQLCNGDLGDAIGYLTEPVFSGEVSKKLAGVSDTQKLIYISPPAPEDQHGFPTETHRALRDIVCRDDWVVPFGPKEELAVCLEGAIKLAEQDKSMDDIESKKFLEHTLSDCFKKLLNSTGVKRWGQETQIGIFHMAELLVRLAAKSLPNDVLQQDLINVLGLLFDPDTEWNQKNKCKQADIYPTYAEPGLTYQSCGWLVDLINLFCGENGLTSIVNKFENNPDLTLPQMAILLRPVGFASPFFKKQTHERVLPIVPFCLDFIQKLSDDDLKSKDIPYCFDIVCMIHKICMKFNNNYLEQATKQCCHLLMRMLKIDHFSTRMTALKELGSLVIACQKVDEEYHYLLNWMQDNKILQLVLRGNLDQVQYADRVRDLLESIAPDLTDEELKNIWDICKEACPQTVDNIHRVLRGAASSFTSDQFDVLLSHINRSWQDGNDRSRSKLLTLIGTLGRDSTLSVTAVKMLDTLWDLCRAPSLPPHLVIQALQEHKQILSVATCRDKLRRGYIIKCLEEIDKSESVFVPLSQVSDLCQTSPPGGPSFKTERMELMELEDTHSIMNLITNSLTKTHALAVSANGGQPPRGDTLVDGKYRHSEYLNSHMAFLRFLHHDGDLFLTLPNCLQIWQTLVLNPNSSPEDNQICFEWFAKCISDLEEEAQENVFNLCVLKLNPCTLTPSAFHCFSTYFDLINLNRQKMCRLSDSRIAVDSLSVQGAFYLWEIIQECLDQHLAMNAISVLIQISYSNLSSRFLKDPQLLHNKFINKCYTKLQESLHCWKVESLGDTENGELVASKMLQCTDRILILLYNYIRSIEKPFSGQRSLIPHAAGFLGKPIFLTIFHFEILLIHSHDNETMESVRQKVAEARKVSPEQISSLIFQSAQLPLMDRSDETQHFKDHLYNNSLLFHLGVRDDTAITYEIKTGSPQCKQNASVSLEDMWIGAGEILHIESVNVANQADPDLQKEEEELPGYIIANIFTEIYSILFELLDVGHPSSLESVCNLLYLIPTDPAVVDKLDGTRYNSAASRVAVSDHKRTLSKVPVSRDSEYQKKKDCNEKIFKDLFDINSPNMSSFRLSYNLQVLSSKLIPLSQDARMATGTQFVEEFLDCGGLHILLNLLEPTALPATVDQRIRRNIYYVVLQILGYWLCGYETDTLDPRPASGLLLHYNKAAMDASCKQETKVTLPTGAQTVRNYFTDLAVDDWRRVLIKLQNITWSCAAGKIPSGASKELSASEDSLNRSESAYEKGFKASKCMQTSAIETTDSLVAMHGLHLLASLLRMRPLDIEQWYTLPSVNEFIIDMLIGCCDSLVRYKASEEFIKVSQIVTPVLPSPRHFLSQVLIQTPLPLWVLTITSRGTTLRQTLQCSQYFDLRAALATDLTLADQKTLGIDANQMLDVEINWLTNCLTTRENNHARPESTIGSIRDSENVIVAGHFILVIALLSCEGVDKILCGKNLIPIIVNEYLFPAAKVVAECVHGEECYEARDNCFPKCTGVSSRVAAFGLLVKLAVTSTENYTTLTETLVFLHHRLDLNNIKEHELSPVVEGRSASGFVGLRNGGATCYMNSILQQIFMVPNLPEKLLQLDTENEFEDSFIYQLQRMFANLKDSQVQYYSPDKFWTNCPLASHNSLDIREQQDAFEFYSRFLDLIEHFLTGEGKDTKLFSKRFEGVTYHQTVCQECPHRYEKEETFLGLSLNVSQYPGLLESLAQYVAEGVLQGENAYQCEKCGKKRTANIRTCIKVAPPILIFHLKRFGYDWDTNQSTKFDNYFQFPRTVDIRPYTVAGLADKEFSSSGEDLSEQVVPDVESSPPKLRSSKPSILGSFSSPRSSPLNYELVGIVVHSGHVNAGHYYSYIKDRRGNTISNPNNGKWFKFNDKNVHEVQMTDEFLEQECFGGKYKAKVSCDSSFPLPEERSRYWNGYLLFYEMQQDFPATPKTPKFCRSSKSLRVSNTSQKFLSFGSPDSKIGPTLATESCDDSSSNLRKAGASLSELSELLEEGEKKGLFKQKAPPKILTDIARDNLLFLKHRDMFAEVYYTFVYSLSSSVLEPNDSPDMGRNATELVLQFLCNTYFRLHTCNKNGIHEWLTLLQKLLLNTGKASIAALEYFNSSKGESHVIPLLMESPKAVVREAFGSILVYILEAQSVHTKDLVSNQGLLTVLFAMLDSDAILANLKNCNNFFKILYLYCVMGANQCAQVLKLGGLTKLVKFLLGTKASGLRRWTNLQTKEFTFLHDTIAKLLLSYDFTSIKKTTEIDLENQEFFDDEDRIVYDMLYGDLRKDWLKKLLVAYRETSVDRSLLTLVLEQACAGDLGFSSDLLQIVMGLYSSVSSSNLILLTELIVRLILIHDSLANERAKTVIYGTVGVPLSGLFDLITENKGTDSRRAYQCMKLIVELAAVSEEAKGVIAQNRQCLHLAVHWLKERIEKCHFDADSNYNEDTHVGHFQRTTSATLTLQEATALLHGMTPSQMETDELELDEIDEMAESSHEQIDIEK